MRQKEKKSLSDKIRYRHRYVGKTLMLLVLTVFQWTSFLPVVFSGETDGFFSALLLCVYVSFEWMYVTVMHFAMKKTNFELEFIAFFLSGIGLCLIASADGSKAMLKQMITVFIGVFLYDFILWFIKDVNRVMKIRKYIGVIALPIFAAAFLYIKVAVGPINGAYNWIYIGSLSIQPSEFMKIVFIFVGAATLDKLLTSKNIYLYILFSMGCIGVLFLMKDFGTALIYFFAFIVIAFMRSGDIRSIAFICAGALIGAVLIFIFLPHVAARFETYRHVWDDPLGKGWQQTSVLMYTVSGGLRGLGIGNGRLRTVYAKTSDLVFGMICEEMGIILGFVIVISFAVILVYAIRCVKNAPSSFYSISACAAASMILFQTCLNIFGITDLLPLTGVTLPFISMGGSSVICCWALFAFIKAADIRAYPKTYKT